MIEPLLMTTYRISTFEQTRALTNASGFLYERSGRLFLVTSRHVLFDEESGHTPDRIEIEIHVDASNLAHSTGFSIPLYRNGKSLWRHARDGAGQVDVVAIEIERAALPPAMPYRAFTPSNLLEPEDTVEIGSAMTIVGFPLGFHDPLHHLPVARFAALASSFGLRFQGQGYFLTDARTHRGISGAPVVMRAADPSQHLGDLPWRLLGIHSSRLDMGTRDLKLDESLGLNCAWYADILDTLTEN